MKNKGDKRGKAHGRYGRFFALVKGQEEMVDREELCLQFTDGRTGSFTGMTDAEFQEMCDCLEARQLQDRNSYKEKVRKARSSVLLRVGRLGINTVDNWDEVNAFLLSPKIAGKLLYEMDLQELKDLTRKLEAILKKGGLKAMKEEEQASAQEQINSMIAATPVKTTTNQKYLS